MRTRTKGYLILIGIVMVLEVLMIRLYIVAANNFAPYQLNDVFNFTRDNDYEGGIGLLLVALFLQFLLGLYLIYQDRRMIKH